MTQPSIFFPPLFILFAIFFGCLLWRAKKGGIKDTQAKKLSVRMGLCMFTCSIILLAAWIYAFFNPQDVWIFHLLLCVAVIFTGFTFQISLVKLLSKPKMPAR